MDTDEQSGYSASSHIPHWGVPSLLEFMVLLFKIYPKFDIEF